MSTKNDYIRFLYDDLLFFLVTSIITDLDDSIRQAEMIIDTWAERNERLTKQSLKAYTKEAMKKDEKLDHDVATILLEIREKVIEGLREDITKNVKNLVISSLKKLKK